MLIRRRPRHRLSDLARPGCARDYLEPFNPHKDLELRAHDVKMRRPMVVSVHPYCHRTEALKGRHANSHVACNNRTSTPHLSPPRRRRHPLPSLSREEMLMSQVLARAAPILFMPQKQPAKPAARRLKVVSEYEPNGDQPTAIRDLVTGVTGNEMDQVLLGVTGSGKTFRSRPSSWPPTRRWQRSSTAR
jgi:hypothetical protein